MNKKNIQNNTKDLLIELVKTNFKLRYNNSFLGFVWVLIKPFATFVILYTVWTAFRGANVEFYQVKLLIGIILFTFLNESVIFGMNGLLDKAHIILKVNFPREIAVLSSVLLAVVNLSINLVIFVVFGIFNHIHWSLIGILWFITSIMIFSLIIYGINLFLSIMIIKLRDLQHIFELFFQLLFWTTPIFYSINDIGGKVGFLISLNPLGMLITIARDALIYGKIGILRIGYWDIQSGYVLISGLLLGIFLVIIGRKYFNNQVKKVAEYF